METPQAAHLKTEIMARQCLNAEIAAIRAAELRPEPCQWLLHIDIDELFILPGEGTGAPTTVADHFAAVPASENYVAYVNHEAVPEHSGPIDNYFTEVSLFKRNPNVFKRQPNEVRIRWSLSQ